MSPFLALSIEHRAEVTLALGALVCLLFTPPLERRPTLLALCALAFTAASVGLGFDYSKSDDVAVPLVAAVLSVSVLLVRSFQLSQRSLRPDAVALLLLGGVGAIALASGDDLLEMAVGLATLSVCASTLIALGAGPRAAEAAFKYFVVTAATFACALFGIALVFFATGSFALPEVSAHAASLRALLSVGLCLFLVPLGVKLALAPFQFGALDAYTAGPAGFVGYVMVLSKVAAVLAMARLARGGGEVVTQALLGCGLLSIVWGVLAGLRQRHLRRLLAYSAVAHAGFLALAAASFDGVRVGAFYAVCYGVSALVIYAALASLGTRELPFDSRFLRRLGPLRASAVILGLFSLAGIPPTPGFWAKLAVLLSTWERFGAVATTIAALGGVLAAIYYLQPIPRLFSAFERPLPSRLGSSGAIIVVGALLVGIAFGPAVLWWLVGA